MTETVQIALIASIAPTMAAAAAFYVSVLNGMKTNTVARKADTIIEKAVEIHTLTNSNLSRVSAALDIANSKIVGLERLMTNMSEAKVTADKVAENLAETATVARQLVATQVGGVVTQPQVAVPPTIPPGVAAVLEDIADNTKETADGVKKLKKL